MTSFDDWNFQNVNWSLDPDIYHTATPSFTTSAYCAILVKHSVTGALSDGRMIFWLRSPGNTLMAIPLFRNQVADGTADIQDTYYLFLGNPVKNLRLSTLVGGAYTVKDNKAYTYEWPVDTWVKLRVTWWSSAGKLLVRVERWTGTEWVTWGGAADADLEDADDLWKDNAINRCGFTFPGLRFLDDVEVWG